MALLVETGQGGSDSESLASVADADAYASNRGLTAWAALVTADKEAALRRASDYLTQTYRAKWTGFRINTVQALDWPRYLVPYKDVITSGAYLGNYSAGAYYANNVVPALVNAACCALAVKSIGIDLSPDLQPRVTAESIGPISVSYAPDGRQYTVYRAIDAMLEPLLKNGGAGVMLVRA
jgi:hypothetical protein